MSLIERAICRVTRQFKWLNPVPLDLGSGPIVLERRGGLIVVRRVGDRLRAVRVRDQIQRRVARPFVDEFTDECMVTLHRRIRIGVAVGFEELGAEHDFAPSDKVDGTADANVVKRSRRNSVGQVNDGVSGAHVLIHIVRLFVAHRQIHDAEHGAVRNVEC